MGKSRVTPKKYVTISRPKLVAAVLSVTKKIVALIRRELDIEWKNETFWTDSKVVLGYINNNTKTLKILLLTEYSRYMRAAMSVNGDMFHLK